MAPGSTVPAVGSCTPARQRSRLDLPAPLRPITTIRSPRRQWKSTSASTVLVVVADAQVGRPAAGPRPTGPGTGSLNELFRSRLWTSVRSDLEPLDPLVERLGDPGPAVGAAPHRVGQLGQPVDLAALELGRALALGLVGLELHQVGRVGALELGEPGVGQVEDLVDGPVEQLEVVGDHQDRPGEATRARPSATSWPGGRGGWWARPGSWCPGPWKRIRIRSTRRRWPPDRLSMSSSRSSWRRPRPSASRAMVDSAS